MAGRNEILLSLCPQVFGMYVIKLAVAMVLAGGVQRIDSSGTKVRGECHLLLVGDPGTGKSQFLKYAAKVISRSVLTAGIGSTSAGLTVAAVKDGGDWHLEAGALVLSDGGLCCIDEFSSIKEHDRISIHEAMEQQSISVAKAGMVCKLNTRTTILAATNPKGQYDPSQPLSVNVALASPLLSRFDLVLVLLDTRNVEWDCIISSFILEDRGTPADASGLWSMEKMKTYFSVIKQLQPQVSEEANCILTRYYQLQRQQDGHSAARTTIRMLESLSRLAEAHARLMYRETVTIEDAVTAVSVMECSMQGGALLGNVNALLTTFPTDPLQQYQTQCQMLLEGLNLPELLQSEMERLARLRSNTPEASVCDLSLSTDQHQLHGSDSETSSDLKSCVTVKSGLDQLPATSPSLSPDDVTLPIITSTQGNINTAPNNSWSVSSALRAGQSRVDKKEQRHLPEKNNNKVLLSEKMAAEDAKLTDLHTKLSAFIFKPRDRKQPDHSGNEAETLREKGINMKTSASHDDLTSQMPQAKKKKQMEKLNNGHSQHCTTKPTAAQTNLERVPHETETSKCELKKSDLIHVPNQHAKPVSNIEMNMRKRKCFNLSPPLNNDGSKPFLSGFSFSGLTDFSSDVLDTNWDQEVSKTTKDCPHK